MEFKKSNRYSKGQSRPQASQKSGPVAIGPNSRGQNASTHQSSSRQTHTPDGKKHIPYNVRRHLFTKKYIIAAILVVAIGSIGVGSVIYQQNTRKPATDTEAVKSAEKLQSQAILPADKSAEQIKGQMLRPPNSDPVYVYTDQINAIPINVTQQVLPESFKGNVDNQVTELAKKFNATSEIDAGNTKVYIGSSAKGPQSVIFTKKDLLILIKSQKKIDDAAWIKYIQTLN